MLLVLGPPFRNRKSLETKQTQVKPKANRGWPIKPVNRIIPQLTRLCPNSSWTLTPPNADGAPQYWEFQRYVLMTSHDLLSRLDHNDEVDVGILDLSKAFDIVPHQRLMRKLRLYGIEGKTSSWISELLLARTQSVLVDGIKSHFRRRDLVLYLEFHKTQSRARFYSWYI